ncbi:MAG TPA: hypothetical protein VHO91_12055, partial [Rhodopila sp.]|nr:hypothetical protein [Rhodopila sp.]
MPRSDLRAALTVVPFQALSRDSTFADAASTEVIRTLSGLETWFSVTSMTAIKYLPDDLRRARYTRKVDYVLHGTFGMEQTKLRLCVQLNDAASGRILWSNRFDHPENRLPALQQSALSRIIEVVPATIYRRELDRLMLVPIDVQTTYDLAIRAFAMTMRPIRGRFAEACELLKLAGERRDGGRQALALVRSCWHLMAISQGWTDNPDVEIGAAAAAIEEANFDDPAARA